MCSRKDVMRKVDCWTVSAMWQSIRRPFRPVVLTESWGPGSARSFDTFGLFLCLACQNVSNRKAVLAPQVDLPLWLPARLYKNTLAESGTQCGILAPELQTWVVAMWGCGYERPLSCQSCGAAVFLKSNLKSQRSWMKGFQKRNKGKSRRHQRHRRQKHPHIQLSVNFKWTSFQMGTTTIWTCWSQTKP